MDATAWAKAVAELVKKQIAAAIAPITKAVDELRGGQEKLRADFDARPAPERGEKGDSADPSQVALALARDDTFIASVRGEKGDRGDQGDDADAVEVARALAADADFAALVRGPKGEKGEKGEQGDAGQDADPSRLEGVEKGLADLQVAAARVDDHAKRIEVLEANRPERGPAGKSAFELAVEHGFEGTLAQWLASLQGKDGERGERGELGVTPEQVADLVKAAVATIPKPADGRDGKDIDPEKVREAIKALVAEIPRPQDGKSPSLDEIRALVADAVKELPPSVTLEQVKDAVHNAFDEIEVPDVEGVRADARQALADARALVAQVTDMVKALPKPLEILDAARSAVAELPKPKDGKDGNVDPEHVRAEVKTYVAAAMNLVQPELLRQLEAELDKRIAALPEPKDGAPGKDASPEQISAAVKAEVAALQDESIERASAMLRTQISELVAPLHKRIEEVATAMPELPELPLVPTPDQVKAVMLPELQPALLDTLERTLLNALQQSLPTPEQIGAQVRAAVESQPKPADGRDGKDVDMDAVRKLIGTEVAQITLPVEQAARIVDERIREFAQSDAIKGAAEAHFVSMVESLIERLEQAHDA